MEDVVFYSKSHKMLADKKGDFREKLPFPKRHGNNPVMIHFKG